MADKNNNDEPTKKMTKLPDGPLTSATASSLCLQQIYQRQGRRKPVSCYGKKDKLNTVTSSQHPPPDPPRQNVPPRLILIPATPTAVPPTVVPKDKAQQSPPPVPKVPVWVQNNQTQQITVEYQTPLKATMITPGKPPQEVYVIGPNPYILTNNANGRSIWMKEVQPQQQQTQSHLRNQNRSPAFLSGEGLAPRAILNTVQPPEVPGIRYKSPINDAALVGPPPAKLPRMNQDLGMSSGSPIEQQSSLPPLPFSSNSTNPNASSNVVASTVFPPTTTVTVPSSLPRPQQPSPTQIKPITEVNMIPQPVSLVRSTQSSVTEVNSKPQSPSMAMSPHPPPTFPVSSKATTSRYSIIRRVPAHPVGQSSSATTLPPSRVGNGRPCAASSPPDVTIIRIPSSRAVNLTLHPGPSPTSSVSPPSTISMIRVSQQTDRGICSSGCSVSSTLCVASSKVSTFRVPYQPNGVNRSTAASPSLKVTRLSVPSQSRSVNPNSNDSTLMPPPLSPRPPLRFPTTSNTSDAPTNRVVLSYVPMPDVPATTTVHSQSYSQPSVPFSKQEGYGEASSSSFPEMGSSSSSVRRTTDTSPPSITATFVPSQNQCQTVAIPDHHRQQFLPSDTQIIRKPEEPRNNTNNERQLAIIESTRPSPPIENIDAKKRIPIQLNNFVKILAHACFCRQRDLRASNNGEKPRIECTVRHCRILKNILGHVHDCPWDKGGCKVNYCATTRSILHHWKNCKEINPCNFCLPIQRLLYSVVNRPVHNSIKAHPEPEPTAPAPLAICYPEAHKPLPVKTAYSSMSLPPPTSPQQRMSTTEITTGLFPFLPPSGEKTNTTVEESESSSCSGSGIESESHFRLPSPFVVHTPISSPSLPPSPPTIQKNPRVFTPDELKQFLFPTVQMLFQMNSKSLPIKLMMDHKANGNSKYYEIIKKPMDVATISSKFDSSQYTEPWEFVEDVWLMFDNARLYNKKNLMIMRHLNKLMDLFKEEIDSVMKKLGFCCGQKYMFNPQTYPCHGKEKQLCVIPQDMVYFCYEDMIDRYLFCQTCFTNIPGDFVNIGEDPDAPSSISIQKNQFEEKKNDKLEPESLVECKVCCRKMHTICVLHVSSIWKDGFICENCLIDMDLEKKENRFTAKKLPATKLGDHLEARVNNFLERKGVASTTGEVLIRVVSSSEKEAIVKPKMANLFVESGEIEESFPYKAKAIFAFQEIDGVEVCFFGMHVQEYGSECPQPNTRRVYLAYLDSVHFFKPGVHRTAVYHEILLGYLDYVKQLGYTTAHIWACPPPKGDDYIFYRHPPEQKTPTHQRLQKWYKKLLNRGLIERIVLEDKNILKRFKDDGFTSVTQLPYFEGDFWPNVLEEAIKTLEQEDFEKRFPQNKISGAAAGSPCPVPVSSKSTLAKQLTYKLLETMELNKDVFFVVRLHSPLSALDLPPIVDPDANIVCDLMDNRDAFLSHSREKHLEFCSLRKAKYSTLALLYELHNQNIVYVCDGCDNNIETSSRFHCTVCDDFDLCHECYERNRNEHPHEMKKLEYVDDDASSTHSGTYRSRNSLKFKPNLERCIRTMNHARLCTDDNCVNPPGCKKIKLILRHVKNCDRTFQKPIPCSICKQMILVCCQHAKTCQDQNCTVVFCSSIKSQLNRRTKQREMNQQTSSNDLVERKVFASALSSSAAVDTAIASSQSSQRTCITASSPSMTSTSTFGEFNFKLEPGVTIKIEPNVEDPFEMEWSSHAVGASTSSALFTSSPDPSLPILSDLVTKSTEQTGVADR